MNLDLLFISTLYVQAFCPSSVLQQLVCWATLWSVNSPIHKDEHLQHEAGQSRTVRICSMRQANLGLCASAASNAGMQTHQEEYASKASQDYFGFLLDSLILSLPLSPLSIGLSLLAHCCCIARHVHLDSRTDTSLLCFAASR